MPFAFLNKNKNLESEDNQNDLLKGKFFMKPFLFPRKSFLSQNENKLNFLGKKEEQTKEKTTLLEKELEIKKEEESKE
jgi:hypothetical protein